MKQPVDDKVIETYIKKTNDFHAVKKVKNPSQDIILFVLLGEEYLWDTLKDKANENTLEKFFDKYAGLKRVREIKVELSPEMQLRAVRVYPDNIDYLVNPTKEAIALAKEKMDK